MKILMTWDEVYKLADGAACGDPELRRKDNARACMRDYIEELDGHDIDYADCPEDEIENYIEENGGASSYMFDESGHLYVGF